MSARIILVEDDIDISIMIQNILTSHGYNVETFEDGISAIEAIRRNPPDLILLDIMLPGIDGKDLCRLVRRELDTPIIMVSALTTELDKVVGLELGADDYITKPFGIMELVARVRSAMRHASGNILTEKDVLRGGDITLDRAKHVVRVGESNVDLRPKEFALLEILLANKGRVLTREVLLERVWEETDYIDHGTVSVHIRRLREKIEKDPNNPVYIVTVRGVGYKFAIED
ncbi:MAG: winged helix-turn-helix domain-containing protein [Armatimonadota bacterium]